MSTDSDKAAIRDALGCTIAFRDFRKARHAKGVYLLVNSVNGMIYIGSDEQASLEPDLREAVESLGGVNWIIRTIQNAVNAATL